MNTASTTKSQYRFNANESQAIYYAKAIGIIAVVIGHYPGNPFTYYSPHIYHMPLFFFIGGMLLNDDRSFDAHVLNLARKNALYIVYIYIAIAIVVWTIHLRYSIDYTALWRDGLWDSIIYPIKNNFHGGSYFLVAWFLFAYTIASIVALPFIKITKKIARSDFISTLLILVIALTLGYVGMSIFAPAYHANKKFYFNTASQISVGLSFLLIGYIARSFVFKITNLCGFILGFFVLYVMHKHQLVGGIGMSWSKYRLGPYAHLTTALIGIYSILFISKLLASNERIALLETIGRQSKSIMSFHLLVFIFVDIVFFEFGLFDISKASRFNHFLSSYSWPIYIIAGVLGPMTASIALEKKMPRSMTKRPPNLHTRLGKP